MTFSFCPGEPRISRPLLELCAALPPSSTREAREWVGTVMAHGTHTLTGACMCCKCKMHFFQQPLTVPRDVLVVVGCSFSDKGRTYKHMGTPCDHGVLLPCGARLAAKVPDADAASSCVAALTTQWPVVMVVPGIPALPGEAGGVQAMQPPTAFVGTDNHRPSEIIGSQDVGFL